MKNTYKLLFASMFMLAACNKNIERLPQNNVSIENYYNTTSEIQTALTGCYGALRNTLIEEWQMTELRSDNSIMGNSGSTSIPNREKSDLDLFVPSTSLTAVYTYWSSVYSNIRNINTILNSLELNYDPAAGTLVKGSTTVVIGDNDYKELSAQAAFLRAYHYFKDRKSVV